MRQAREIFVSVGRTNKKKKLSGLIDLAWPSAIGLCDVIVRHREFLIYTGLHTLQNLNHQWLIFFLLFFDSVSILSPPPSLPRLLLLLAGNRRFVIKQNVTSLPSSNSGKEKVRAPFATATNSYVHMNEWPAEFPWKRECDFFRLDLLIV